MSKLDFRDRCVADLVAATSALPKHAIPSSMRSRTGVDEVVPGSRAPQLCISDHGADNGRDLCAAEARRCEQLKLRSYVCPSLEMTTDDNAGLSSQGESVKTLYVLAAIAGVTAVLPATAAEHCSIHPPKGMSDSQLTSLAKVSRADAEKIAIVKLHEKGVVSVASAELEAEHGCLIWSFDLRIAGKSGVKEIQVDAGDGKVLSVKHESAVQEAAEASKEKTATPGK